MCPYFLALTDRPRSLSQARSACQDEKNQTFWKKTYAFESYTHPLRKKGGAVEPDHHCCKRYIDASRTATSMAELDQEKYVLCT